MPTSLVPYTLPTSNDQQMPTHLIEAPSNQNAQGLHKMTTDGPFFFICLSSPVRTPSAHRAGHHYSQLRHRWPSDSGPLPDHVADQLRWHRRPGDRRVDRRVRTEVGQLRWTANRHEDRPVESVFAVCKVSYTIYRESTRSTIWFIISFEICWCLRWNFRKVYMLKKTIMVSCAVFLSEHCSSGLPMNIK